jgi:hypothetical protein
MRIVHTLAYLLKHAFFAQNYGAKPEELALISNKPTRKMWYYNVQQKSRFFSCQITAENVPFV